MRCLFTIFDEARDERTGGRSGRRRLCRQHSLSSQRQPQRTEWFPEPLAAASMAGSARRASAAGTRGCLMSWQLDARTLLGPDSGRESGYANEHELQRLPKQLCAKTIPQRLQRCGLRERAGYPSAFLSRGNVPLPRVPFDGPSPFVCSLLDRDEGFVYGRQC